MPTDVYMVKTPGGILVPNTDDCREAMKKLPNGVEHKVSITRPRNSKFHRKWFALLKLGFDIWCETSDKNREYRGCKVMPDIDQFRADITILCGFYTPIYRTDGSVRLKPKSISFHAMDDDEFERLYQQTINVLLQKVIPNDGLTEAILRNYVDNVMSFAT